MLIITLTFLKKTRHNITYSLNKQKKTKTFLEEHDDLPIKFRLINLLIFKTWCYQHHMRISLV